MVAEEARRKRSRLPVAALRVVNIGALLAVAVDTARLEANRAARRAACAAVLPVVVATGEVEAAEDTAANEKISSHRVRSPFSVGPDPFFLILSISHLLKPNSLIQWKPRLANRNDDGRNFRERTDTVSPSTFPSRSRCSESGFE